MTKIPDALPTLESLDLPAPDAPQAAVSAGRFTPPLDLPLLNLPSEDFLTIPDTLVSDARTLQRVAFDIQEVLSPILSRSFDDAERFSAPPTIHQTDPAQQGLIREAFAALDEKNNFSSISEVVNVLIDIHQHTNSHQSLSNGNVALWGTVASQQFEAGARVDQLKHQNPNTLRDYATHLDASLASGSITLDEHRQATAGVVAAIGKYEKIKPLLEEAERMLPSYFAKIDAAALGTEREDRGGR